MNNNYFDHIYVIHPVESVEFPKLVKTPQPKQKKPFYRDLLEKRQKKGKRP